MSKVKVNKGHEISKFSDDPWENMLFVMVVLAGREAHFGEGEEQGEAREFLQTDGKDICHQLGIYGAREVFKFGDR